MKKIKLTQGKYALIDNEDFELVSQYKWMLDNNGYATTWKYIPKYKNNRFTAMHKIILRYNKKLRCDHKNENKLDNRKSNLRICTHGQNLQNRNKPINNISGYKGVDFSKNLKKYRARICINYKIIHLGYFKTAKEAGISYNKAAKKLHGEFANTNKIQ